MFSLPNQHVGSLFAASEAAGPRKGNFVTIFAESPPFLCCLQYLVAREEIRKLLICRCDLTRASIRFCKKAVGRSWFSCVLIRIWRLRDSFDGGNSLLGSTYEPSARRSSGRSVSSISGENHQPSPSVGASGGGDLFRHLVDTRSTRLVALSSRLSEPPVLNSRSILQLAYAHDDDIRTPGAGAAAEQGAGYSRAPSYPAEELTLRNLPGDNSGQSAKQENCKSV